MNTRGSRFEAVLLGEAVNPFEVLGLTPRANLTIEDIGLHVLDVVMPHLTDPATVVYRHAPTLPTMRQVLRARDQLMEQGALDSMLERWLSCTVRVWDPLAQPGSPESLPSNPARPAPAGEGRWFFQRPTRMQFPPPPPPPSPLGTRPLSLALCSRRLVCGTQLTSDADGLYLPPQEETSSEEELMLGYPARNDPPLHRARPRSPVNRRRVSPSAPIFFGRAYESPPLPSASEHWQRFRHRPAQVSGSLASPLNVEQMRRSRSPSVSARRSFSFEDWVEME